jgi:hypothetical protein
MRRDFMDSLIVMVLLLAGWFLLQSFILPKLGVNT